MKRFSKPWITKGIRASIKVKNKLFLSGDNVKYKLYRNRLNKLIQISKKNYYHNYFNSHNMKKTWEGINNLLYRNTKSSRQIHLIKDPDDGGKICRDPQKIANVLNEHFVSVGRKLADKIPDFTHHHRFLISTKSPGTSFFFRPVSAGEVELEILNLPNNKSHGLYSCPVALLKLSRSSISSILAKIFNLSVSTGKYPSKLKMSKIIPIFKSEDETNANNYRPISLLSIYDRILEKMMYKRMKVLILITSSAHVNMVLEKVFPQNMPS